MNLDAGEFIYGYPTNKMAKCGDSLLNKKGKMSRLTAHHPTSVGGLKYTYVIYMQKEHIIKFRTVLQDKFPRFNENRDIFLVPIKKIESFILEYCELME